MKKVSLVVFMMTMISTIAFGNVSKGFFETETVLQEGQFLDSCWVRIAEKSVEVDGEKYLLVTTGYTGGDSNPLLLLADSEIQVAGNELATYKQKRRFFWQKFPNVELMLVNGEPDMLAVKYPRQKEILCIFE